METLEIKKIIRHYGPYIKEIKKKFIRFCYLFFAVFFVGFFLANPIIKFILKFFSSAEIHVVVASPFQFFSVAFDIALFLAIIITFPVIIFSIYGFFKPALDRREKAVFRKMIVAGFCLFLFGFFFGLAVMYYAIIFLAKFNTNLGVANMWDMSLFISQILLASALLGVCFQYPIVLSALIRFKIISVNFLRANRRWAILGSVVLAAILPPPDVLATIVMAMSLIILYEITIFVNRERDTGSVGALRKASVI